MMREIILANIRRAIKRDQANEATLNLRLQNKPRGILPALSGDIQNIFRDKMQKSFAKVEQINFVSESILVLEKILQDNQLQPQFRLANNPLLNLIPFKKQWTLQYGAAEPSDVISVTEAFCGVAETGTLVLLSSPDSPTTLNFLPPIHVVLLNIKNIVAHYEDALDLIQSSGKSPRTINFISGPSRTSDIEQTAQFGAHGPKQLYVLLFQEEK
jgi:L-lactate dehydrogenase complex protein LldG